MSGEPRVRHRKNISAPHGGVIYSTAMPPAQHDSTTGTYATKEEIANDTR